MNSNERGADKFRASVPGASTQMPEFMRDHAGRGKETGFGPEDLSWLGDDGNLNFEQLLAKRGFDPLLPLEYILLAIIDGYPTDGTDRGSKRQRRLETALAALVGPEQRKRGMDEKADYELLLRMGWQYHCLFWNSGGKPPDVTNLAKRCYEDLPTDDPRRHASSQS